MFSLFISDALRVSWYKASTRSYDIPNAVASILGFCEAKVHAAVLV